MKSLLPTSSSLLSCTLQMDSPMCHPGQQIGYRVCVSCSLVSNSFETPWTVAGLPRQLSSKRICMQRRRCRFDPWVRKIPWRRAWQPTPVFFPGESHGQRSLVGYSPWGCKESDTTEVTECVHACTHTRTVASGSSVHGDSPGKNTRVGSHFLLQGRFPIQGSNLGLPHCRQRLYYLSHQGGHPLFVIMRKN